MNGEGAGSCGINAEGSGGVLKDDGLGAQGSGALNAKLNGVGMFEVWDFFFGIVRHNPAFNCLIGGGACG